MNSDILRIFNTLAMCLPGFLFAIVAHEASHALMAKYFGDDTAEREGRLSLNPMVHADLVGTVVFPLFGIMIGGIPFGWAKPVPVNPSRFRSIKHGTFWVSFAGPGMNLLLGFFSAFLKIMVLKYLPESVGLKMQFVQILNYSALINIVLAVFNLLPFPPLDGSKMVSVFLDYNQLRKFEELQRYTFVFILILWFTNIFSYIMMPAIYLVNLFESILYYIL